MEKIRSIFTKKRSENLEDTDNHDIETQYSDTPRLEGADGVNLHESLKNARRFHPHIHGTEGFFICKMRKTEGESK